MVMKFSLLNVSLVGLLQGEHITKYRFILPPEAWSKAMKPYDSKFPANSF